MGPHGPLLRDYTPNTKRAFPRVQISETLGFSGTPVGNILRIPPGPRRCCLFPVGYRGIPRGEKTSCETSWVPVGRPKVSRGVHHGAPWDAMVCRGLPWELPVGSWGKIQ